MILFDEIIFGPVKSRRLGISLGINLLPTNSKFCNFNCIYCECGLSENIDAVGKVLPSCEAIKKALENKLQQMIEKNEKLDAITFAGNGEPTIHPEFAAIIDDTINARNKYYPKVAITVLSNATMLHKDTIVSALKKIEKCYLKIDSGVEETLKKINQPAPNYSLSRVIENLQKFKGNFILQTMFTRGEIKNEIIDNTTVDEISAWLSIIQKTKPKLVSIYSIQRIPPYKSLEIVPPEELEIIAQKVRNLGIEIEVAK